MKRKCGIDGCDVEHRARGLCNRHYLIILRGGGFRVVSKYARKNRNITERLLSAMEIDQETSCWNWQLTITQKTPKIRYMGKTQLAYRVSYEAFIENIPPGLTIDHLCENRRCINPFHLEPTTPQENTRRYHENRRFERNNY